MTRGEKSNILGRWPKNVPTLATTTQRTVALEVERSSGSADVTAMEVLCQLILSCLLWLRIGRPEVFSIPNESFQHLTDWCISILPSLYWFGRNKSSGQSWNGAAGTLHRSREPLLKHKASHLGPKQPPFSSVSLGSRSWRPKVSTWNLELKLRVAPPIAFGLDWMLGVCYCGPSNSMDGVARDLQKNGEQQKPGIPSLNSNEFAWSVVNILNKQHTYLIHSYTNLFW